MLPASSVVLTTSINGQWVNLSSKGYILANKPSWILQFNKYNVVDSTGYGYVDNVYQIPIEELGLLNLTTNELDSYLTLYKANRDYTVTTRVVDTMQFTGTEIQTVTYTPQNGGVLVFKDNEVYPSQPVYAPNQGILSGTHIQFNDTAITDNWSSIISKTNSSIETLNNHDERINTG